MTTALTPEIEAEALRLGDPGESDRGEEEMRYLSDRFLEGRKAYRCAHCYRMIAVGERHRAIRVVFDGEVAGCRYCAECCAAYVQENREWDYSFTNRLNLATTLEAVCQLVRGASIQGEQG